MLLTVVPIHVSAPNDFLINAVNPIPKGKGGNRTDPVIIVALH